MYPMYPAQIQQLTKIWAPTYLYHKSVGYIPIIALPEPPAFVVSQKQLVGWIMWILHGL